MVTIHRLEDSAGLEAALREHGIDAEVSFQPTDTGELGITNYVDSEGNIGQGPPPAEGGSTDAAGRGRRRRARARRPAAAPSQALSPPRTARSRPSRLRLRHRRDPATLSHEGDDWVLRIPADSPLQDRPVQIATGEGGDLMVATPATRPTRTA